MNAHASRRYVDDLLRGRTPKPFLPDDFEAAQIRTAIDLRTARLGADAPRQEFLSDLHRRLDTQMRGTPPDASAARSSMTRRQVMVETSAAAAAAVAAVAADRLPPGDHSASVGNSTTASADDMTPSSGSWQ